MPGIWEFSATAQTRIVLQGNGGRELHGFLFQWLDPWDPDFLRHVHSLKTKPFSLMLRYDSVREPVHHTRILDAGQDFCFVVASLSADFDRLLRQAADSWPGTIGRFGEGSFAGAQARYLVPWQSYEDLWTEAGRLAETNGRRLTLKFGFQTPTSFRQRGRQYLLPDPSAVFRSLLIRWNAHAPFRFPEVVAEDWDEILISSYQLRTQLVKFDNHSIKGFIGEVAYLVPTTLSLQVRQTLVALFLLAPFSGVGYHPTHGLGKTTLLRPVPSWLESPKYPEHATTKYRR